MKEFINWVSFIVCAVLPLYIIRFKFLETPTTLLEILILILFLIWFLDRGLKMKNWLKFFNFGEFGTPIIFLILASIAATFWSFDEKNGLGILKAYLIDPALLFLVVLDRVKSDGGKYFFSGLIAASVWLSILAIFQKLTAFGFPEYAQNEIAQGRVVGVYNSANSLALFIGPIFSLLLGWVFSQLPGTKNPLMLMLAIFILVLQAIVLILTQSQAAIFAISAVSIFIVLARITSFEKVVILFKQIFKIAILLTILLPVFPIFGINLGTFFSDETLQNRNYVWGGTVALIMDRPLTGAGLDGFKELYGESYSTPAYGELLQYPHNLFLTFWSELGLFGALAFFWILFKFAHKAGENRFLGLGLMASILYLLIHGIVDVPYFKNDLSAQFFVLLALSMFKG